MIPGLKIFLNVCCLVYMIIGLTVLIDGYLIRKIVLADFRLLEPVLCKIKAIQTAARFYLGNMPFDTRNYDKHHSNILSQDFTFAFGVASLTSAWVHNSILTYFVFEINLHKDMQVLRPREVYPLLVLYILYEMYIAAISSMKLITYLYPMGILLLTPLSYWIFSWAGQEQLSSDSQEINLEKAWKNMGYREGPEELDSFDGFKDKAPTTPRKLLSSTGGMYSLSELYASRIQKAGPNWVKDDSTLEEIDQDDTDEENFLFVPKPSYVPGVGKGEESSLFSSSVETVVLWLSKPWEVLFGLILPHQKYPGVSFFMIIAFCFVISDLQLEMADGIISYLGFNSNFIALTFYNLFSNMPDLLTVITAAKNKEFTLALATIFSSQVLNLQVSLTLPWLIRCVLWGGYSSAPSPMQNMSMYSAVSILAVIAILLPINRYRLNTLFGVLLLLLYLGYVIIVHKFI